MTKQEMKKEAYKRIESAIFGMNIAETMENLECRDFKTFAILRFAYKCGLINDDDYQEFKEKISIFYFENRERIKKENTKIA